jgi:integrase/recombinase XerC
MSVLEALDAFLVQLQADGRGWSIAAQYSRHVRLLDRWLAERGYDRDISALSHQRVAEFLASDAVRLRPDGRPKRATSLNVLRGSIRSFLRYAYLAGMASDDPGRLIRRARCSSPPPRWLSPEECRRLLAAISERGSAASKRDRMLVELLLGTGIRLGTALALTAADVDLRRRLLVLREMKGDRPDVLPISAEVGKALKAYLRGRAPGPIIDNGAGGALGRRQAARRLELWGAQAGLAGRVSAHQLRHTFARRLYDKTRDVLVVKELLRHRSVASTLVYAAVDRADLRRALRR